VAGPAGEAQSLSRVGLTDMTESPKTVAVLYSHRLHIGGVETHLLSLFRQRALAPYRWLIVAPASPEFAALARPASTIAWAAPQAVDPRALVNLVRLLRREGVQLLHAHNPRAALYGGLAARWLGLPMLVTVHLPAYYWVRGPTPLARFRRWAYQQMDRILNRWLVDRVIYVSRRVCDEARGLGVVTPTRSQVIPNGIELRASMGEAAPLASIPAVTPGVPVLCCVGRLDPQKGIDVLLAALHSLRSRAWRLWLVGDGPELENLQGLARQLNLQDQVDFLGFRADVAALLQASAIFVLPSRYEAMSLALLEALAAGRPCVVTDVGENAAVIETGVNGLVVPAEDPQRLAAALEQLLADASLRQRMGQAAQRSAATFEASAMGRQLQTVYAALLAS
jgi:glycosyltransferase involved in cell wall biosynthesis